MDNEYYDNLFLLEGEGNTTTTTTTTTVATNGTNAGTGTGTGTGTAEIDLSIFAIVVHSIASIFCLICFIFTIIYWKNPIIALSQPRFLIVIITGASFISYAGFFLVAAANLSIKQNHDFSDDDDASPILKGSDDSDTDGDRDRDDDLVYDILCMGWVWLFVAGLIFVYMGLFGKLRRIHKVCQLRSRNAPPIPYWYGMWPFAIMRCIVFILLMAWAIVGIPKWTLLGYNDSIDGNEIGICDFTGSKRELIFIIPLAILILISAILGANMAYRIRNLPNELSDVHGIYYVYCCHLIGLIVIGSLYIIGRILIKPTILVLAISFLTVFESITSIAPIMIPKMYYIWYENKFGKLPDGIRIFGGGQIHVTVNGNGNTGNSNNNSNNNRNSTSNNNSSTNSA